MLRPSATVVVLAWNAWQATETCLKTLLPTLRDDDRVVVVDNGSVDGTAEGLRSFPRVEVRTNAQNRGFAAGCNQGAEGAGTGAVVFLNNDTVVPPGWLDGLLAPLTDPTVVATGPRSNMVSGVQLIDDVAAYSATTVEHVRDFAADWSTRHAGQVRETRRLVGFCLAVRTADLEAVGGFDEGFGLGGCEDDELCGRLAERGLLLVVDDVFIHHDGHVTFDSNGLDWHALQRDNASRLVALQSTAPSTSAMVPLPGPQLADDAPRAAVSVVVLAERSARHLHRALRGIAGQHADLRSIDVLVVVGGESDRRDLDLQDAAEVVADVLRVAPALRVRLVEQDGARATRLNAGLRLAGGSAVAVLDTNEDWFPHHLSVLLADWSDDEVRYSYAVRCLQDDKLTVLRREVEGDIEFDRMLLSLTRFAVPGAVLAPTDAVRRVGGFDESLSDGEYWELQLRLAAALPFRLVGVPSVRHYVPADQADRGERPLRAATVAAVYARHPLSARSALAAQREAVLDQLRAMEEPPIDVSFVVAADSGPDQLSALVTTLQTGLAIFGGSRWELVLVLPDRETFAPALDQLDGARVLIEPEATVPEALALGAGVAAGRHCLQAAAGETVSPELVAAALRSGVARAQVGVRLPLQRSAFGSRGVQVL